MVRSFNDEELIDLKDLLKRAITTTNIIFVFGQMPPLRFDIVEQLRLIQLRERAYKLLEEKDPREDDVKSMKQRYKLCLNIIYFGPGIINSNTDIVEEELTEDLKNQLHEWYLKESNDCNFR